MKSFTAALIGFSIQACALRLYQEIVEEELDVELDVETTPVEKSYRTVAPMVRETTESIWTV